MNISGLYIHIPICSRICTYCDFVKTARWGQDLNRAFLNSLLRHIKFWIEKTSFQTLSSINVGGGTPSLWAEEYFEIFDLLKDFITPETEVTLEANPINISEERLQIWKACGFNRISLGIQTFEPKGLKLLGRDHSPQQAKDAFLQTQNLFPRANLDMIYGWPTQTLQDLRHDLQKIEDLNPSHISLYNLEYPKKTVLGRQLSRGKIRPQTETVLEDMYTMICTTLNQRSYNHHEVSNWSQPGETCRHNMLYWENGFWIGVGPGAAGLLPPTKDFPYGNMYQYKDSIHSFMKEEPSFNNLCIEKDRDMDSWIAEIIGRSLRTKNGVPLEYLLTTTRSTWEPSSSVRHALETKQATLQKGFLIFEERQWLRETAWCVEVMSSLRHSNF
ncbi:MAG: radical SAM family heme chaperone HemW [Oligoflexales bacterium]